MPVLAHVGSGAYEPLQVAGLTFFAAAYAIRVSNLARDARPVPTWKIRVP